MNWVRLFRICLLDLLYNFGTGKFEILSACAGLIKEFPVVP